jgi:hypothetical protein
LSSDFAYYLVWPSQKANWRPLLQLRNWLGVQANAAIPAPVVKPGKHAASHP